MSRICELTGKTRLVGNNDTLGKGVKLRVSTHGLRSVEHVGGLDNWLLKTKDDKLSLRVKRLKKEIAKKQVAPA